MIRRVKQKGFTLIELIIVIVILGILAAFILPRFSNISSQARAATVDALAGSLKAASAITHGQWLVAGNSPATITLEDGTVVTMTFGYPAVTSSGILAALQGAVNTSASTLDTFTYSTAGSVMTFTPRGVVTPATCFVTYTAAPSANSGAAIAFGDLGC